MKIEKTEFEAILMNCIHDYFDGDFKFYSKDREKLFSSFERLFYLINTLK